MTLACDINNYVTGSPTTYDAAYAACMAANGEVYFPSLPTCSTARGTYSNTTITVFSGYTYLFANTLTVNNGQSIRGDGSAVTFIEMTNSTTPTITLGASMWSLDISGVTLMRASQASAGGDGLYQAQGGSNWVNSGTINDVYSFNNYNGFNLGVAFSCRMINCGASKNVQTGFKFTSPGLVTVPSGSASGALQWVLTDCGSGSNGYDGYSYNVTGALSTGISCGTLENCDTYANGHHGMACYGTAACPIHSVRVIGGFYGQDGGNEFFIDSHAENHIVSPNFCELAALDCVNLTANNTNVVMANVIVNGAGQNGVNSSANGLQITGGSFTNNGLSGGTGNNWDGIRISGGSAVINGALVGNFNGSTTQHYGLSITGDNVIVGGCDLRNNTLAPIYWASGPSASIVTGCLPRSANFA